MEFAALPVTMIVIEQDSDVISSLIAFLAETKEVSLHFYPTCDAASRARKMKRAEILLFTDTGQQKDVKKFSRITRRYPGACAMVTLPEKNAEKERAFANAGVQDFLYKNDLYIAELRMSLRKLLLSRFLSAIRQQTSEEDFKLFSDHISRLIRGDLLSHYRIQSEIVSTLSGRIYKCEDLQNNQIVSLQVLPPDYDEKFSPLLMTEARKLTSFQHAGIARVLEVSDSEDLWFVASEYLEGETLSAVMEGGPLGLLRVLDIGAQVGDALDAAHTAGFVHGGIRPSNIIVTENEGAKLLDFPRTRRLATPVSALPLEVVRYMSPEQLRGEEADRSSDIFSLGSVLYHAATGTSAFQATNAVSMQLEIITEDPPPAGSIKQDLPEQFDKILARCLTKDKAQRYATAAELAYALRRVKLSTIYNLPPEGEEDDEVISLPAPVPQAPPPLSLRAKIIASAVCLFLVSITAAFFYSVAPRKEIIPTLAILPFGSAPGPLNTEYLGHGVTAGLIDSLAGIGSWRVLPSTTAFRLKSSGFDRKWLQKEYGMTEYVSGQVEQSGQGIRITTGLYNAQGSEIWKQSFTARRPSDVLEVQNEIARRIAARMSNEREELSLKLTVHQPKIAAAYPFFLRANYLAGQDDQTALLQSIELYRKAVMIDSKYAAAYAALADARLTLITRYAGYSNELYSQALQTANEAIELDPSLARAYRVKGAVNLLHDWDFSESEKHLRRAISIDAGDAASHGYLAILLTARENFPESLSEIRAALALEPDSDFLNEQYAYLLMQQRRFDEAIAQVNRQSERHGSPYLYRILGDCYMAKRMHDQAQRAYRLSEDLGSSNAQVRVAAAMAAAGLKSEASALLLNLEKDRGGEYIVPDFMAAAFAVAGEDQKALDWLEKAFDEHSDSMLMLKVNFFWDPLRNDWRFQRLVNRVF